MATLAVSDFDSVVPTVILGFSVLIPLLVYLSTTCRERSDLVASRAGLVLLVSSLVFSAGSAGLYQADNALADASSAANEMADACTAMVVLAKECAGSCPAAQDSLTVAQTEFNNARNVLSEDIIEPLDDIRTWTEPIVWAAYSVVLASLWSMAVNYLACYCCKGAPKFYLLLELLLVSGAIGGGLALLANICRQACDVAKTKASGQTFDYLAQGKAPASWALDAMNILKDNCNGECLNLVVLMESPLTPESYSQLDDAACSTALLGLGITSGVAFLSVFLVIFILECLRRYSFVDGFATDEAADALMRD